MISAAGTFGGTVPVAQWWPGIALGVTFVSLSPNFTPRQQLIFAVPLIAFTGAVGWIVFSSQANFWPPAAIVIISAGPLAIGAAGGVVFSYAVVARTLALLDTAAGSEEFYLGRSSGPGAAEGTVARMSARVGLLESVASAGSSHRRRRSRPSSPEACGPNW